MATSILGMRRLLSSRPWRIGHASQLRYKSTFLSQPLVSSLHSRSPLSYIPQGRYQSSLAVADSSDSEGQNPNKSKGAQKTKPQEPAYELTFTCKPCLHRSAHRITKHGYHRGTVLITCPSCKARHVIADHLKVFLDSKSTLEDILRRKAAEGQDFTKLLKKGKLGMRQGAMVGNEGEEDLEFWEDGTESLHSQSGEKS